jgi:ribosome-binding factor A
MLGYKRSDRVGELILHEISKIVQEFKESDIGLITITHVKLTDDLQDARIFYSVLGSEEQVRNGQMLMKNSLPSIRHELARRLNLRFTPRLSLEVDTTPQTASRIFELLEQIEKERIEPEKTLKGGDSPLKTKAKPACRQAGIEGSGLLPPGRDVPKKKKKTRAQKKVKKPGAARKK